MDDPLPAGAGGQGAGFGLIGKPTWPWKVASSCLSASSGTEPKFSVRQPVSQETFFSGLPQLRLHIARN
jgi:hypothetical protein